MKIPKKIKILGVPYKIVLKEKLKDDNERLSDTQLGWTKEGTHTIELATTEIFCKELKEQTNDYIRLQTAILLCYDLITIYSKISAIKYSREISLLTSKQNLSNILNKIFERKIKLI